jgi:hypothetical protein
VGDDDAWEEIYGAGALLAWTLLIDLGDDVRVRRVATGESKASWMSAPMIAVVMKPPARERLLATAPTAHPTVTTIINPARPGHGPPGREPW